MTDSVLSVFMLVKSTPEWLGLPAGERADALHAHLQPLLAKHGDRIKLRFFDIEFYSARVTDVWMWESTSHHAYELLVEDLRETPFWDRYFEILEILPGVENAFARDFAQAAMAE